jgi:hypothetical protein
MLRTALLLAALTFATRHSHAANSGWTDGFAEWEFAATRDHCDSLEGLVMSVRRQAKDNPRIEDMNLARSAEPSSVRQFRH